MTTRPSLRPPLTLMLALLVSVAASARAAPIRISEVLYDAEGSDDGRVFVELFGPAGALLDGYVLEGVNGSNGDVSPVVALVGVIPDDGFFVVADLASGITEVPDADLLRDFDFQNGGTGLRN